MRSICLMVKFSARAALRRAVCSTTSSICFCRYICWRSKESGIFSNWLCPMTMISKLPVAMRAQNFFRFAFSKSVLRATRISALGYSSKASAAICSVRWLGTTISVLLQSPSRFFSMALATISNVFPAPTSCASSTLLPYSTWAMALRWCGRRVISGFMPGKCRWLPSYSRGRRQLNLVLYIETNRWRRVGSLKIQS